MFKRNDGDAYHKGEKYIENKNSLVSYSMGGKYICVTTTMGCLVKNNWLDDLDFECEPTYHQIPNEHQLKLML